MDGWKTCLRQAGCKNDKFFRAYTPVFLIVNSTRRRDIRCVHRLPEAAKTTQVPQNESESESL